MVDLAVFVHEVGHAAQWLQRGRKINFIRAKVDGSGVVDRADKIENLPELVRSRDDSLKERHFDVMVHAENYVAGLAAERLYTKREEAVSRQYWASLCGGEYFLMPSCFKWWEQKGEPPTPDLDQELAIGLVRWLEGPDSEEVSWERARERLATEFHRAVLEFSDPRLWAAITATAETLSKREEDTMKGENFSRLWREGLRG